MNSHGNKTKVAWQGLWNAAYSSEDLKYRACVLLTTFMMRFCQFCHSFLFYEEEQPGYSSKMYLLCSEKIKLYEFETA